MVRIPNRKKLKKKKKPMKGLVWRGGMEIIMDAVFWDMLDRLLRMMQSRSRMRGLKLPCRRRLLGSILSDFFLRHYEEILSDQSDVTLEATRQYLAKHFDARELAVIDTTSVPEVRGDGSPTDVRSADGAACEPAPKERAVRNTSRK